MAVKAKANKKNAVITAVVLTVLLIFIIVITAASVNSREVEYYDFEKDTATGIDVSEHNGKIDWQTVKANVDFAFIRVGYRGWGTGKIVKDKYAADNMKGAKKAGLPFGVYFYSQATDEKEAKEEAKFVIKMIKRYNPQLPVIIDFEYPTDEEGSSQGRMYDAFLTADENTAIINSFCNTVKDSGFAFGVYASSSVLDVRINEENLVKDALVWTADYNGEVTHKIDYKIWQYTRTGQCDGVSSKNVDFNYYYSKIQKG